MFSSCRLEWFPCAVDTGTVPYVDSEGHFLGCLTNGTSRGQYSDGTCPCLQYHQLPALYWEKSELVGPFTLARVWTAAFERWLSASRMTFDPSKTEEQSRSPLNLPTIMNNVAIADIRNWKSICKKATFTFTTHIPHQPTHYSVFLFYSQSLRTNEEKSQFPEMLNQIMYWQQCSQTVKQSNNSTRGSKKVICYLGGKEGTFKLCN